MKTTYPIHSISRRLSWIVGLILLTFFAATITACSDDTEPLMNDTGIIDDVGDKQDTGNTDVEPTDVGPVEDTDDGDKDIHVPKDTDPIQPDVENDTEQPDTDPVRPDVPPEVRLTIEAIEPNRGNVDGGTSFVIRGTSLTNDTEVFFGARRAMTELVDGKLLGVTPGASGVGPVNVKLLDPVTGNDTLIGGFTYTSPLEIFSITPSILPSTGDIEVTVNGFGFNEDTRISFGGNTASRHTLIDESLMRVIAPAHAPGVVNVRASNLEGTFVLANAATYFEALNIKSVAPSAGLTSGGETVTLTGAGFKPGMVVEFNGVPATDVQVEADGTSVTVKTPAHAEGLVYVRIENTDGDAAILADAFYYYGAATDLAIVAVSPNRGMMAGGDVVKIIGSGLDTANLQILFGDELAEIQPDAEIDHIIVKTPSRLTTPGTVNVTARTTPQDESVLIDAFTYVADVWVETISPNTGSVDGGEAIEIKGEGFTGASRVLFGNLAAEFTIVDDETIIATSPAHAAAKVDIAVERDGIAGTFSNAFTYIEDIAIHGFFPTRGSLAGNTYVEIHGRGFSGTPQVMFGEEEAFDVRVLDSQTITVRTPPHRSGAVDLKVSVGNDETTADKRFTFFNSGARFGGAWGGPIEGAVNVTVFSTDDRGNPTGPTVGAHVMLSTNAATPYIGRTNEDGMVTLSGPDVYGEQTITAIAAKHTSTTVQRINAENITIFLEGGDEEDGDGGGSPAAGFADATFTGRLTGLNKLEEPKQGERLRAYVFTTTRSAWSQNPEVDPFGPTYYDRFGYKVDADGPYTIKTRLGDLALVAVGGIYNERTGAFRPIRMGVVRYLFAADSETYTVNIPLDIDLDASLSMKYNNIPPNPGGAWVNNIQPFLDLGFEGVFRMLSSAKSTESILTAPQMAPLRGKIADANYFVIGGTYRSVGSQFGNPSSEAYVRDIYDIDIVQPMPPLPGIPRLTTPSNGGPLVDRTVHFSINSTVQPEYFKVIMYKYRSDEIVWEAYIPGDATSIRFPDFPSFAHLPANERPAPYPGGLYELTFIGVRGVDISYEGFSYDDLAYSSLEARSVGFGDITF